MATSKLELAVGTGRWDAGLKKAQEALNNFTSAQGGLQQALAKDNGDMQKFIQMMGKIDSTANTTKGQMNDYKRVLEQLTTQYNQMSDAQKKSIGQDYLQTIDSLKQKFSKAKQQVEDFNKSLGEAGKIKMPESSGGGLFSGGKLDGMLQVFGGNLMTKAAGMATGLAMEIGDAVKQGIELAKQGEGIRIAFERLGRGDILDGLRQATHGTVTDIELMKAAVKFNDFKLPLDQLGTMLAFAQQKAKDTGQSVDYMVESITNGLGRQSKPILDNLGISAKEIEERMKSTGDFTKAVGEIIREQMAKAGDYVETAADRAAQANVSLQNKMEELGRKFGPLEEASSNFWTSMKIGILDVIGGPLSDLLNKLTEAGRVANQYGVLGGNAKVGRMITNLAGAKEGDRQSLYQQQQAKIWEYINRRETYMKDRQRWINGGSQDGELRNSLISQAKTLGTSNVNEIKAQIDAAKKMLSEYQSAAKSILTPVKADISGLDPKALPTQKTNTKTNYAPDSIAAQEAEVQKLTKAWREAGEAVRDDYKKQLEEAQYTLDKMTGKGFDPSKLKEVSGISSMATGMTQTLTLPMTISIQSPVEKWKSEIAELKQAIADAWDPSSVEVYQARIAELEKNIGAFTGKSVKGNKESVDSFRAAAQAVNSVGSALQSIEDPSAKIAGIVGSAIANIALGFAEASSKEGKGGVWYWIAATAAGLANMVSTIATIHSATGYAQGGRITGTTYSGDQIGGLVDGGQLVGLNAGEIVLNQAMQNNVASALRDGSQGLTIVGEIQGEKIVLVANRFFKRTGQGEIVTW